ncbi:Cold shock protein, CspA family [Chitinophaga sp. YR627]|nr:Cold shock protein, CspA family [Chitinophaga sp. YR627]
MREILKVREFYLEGQSFKTIFGFYKFSQFSQMTTKYQGTVKFFNETKGFGFIIHEESDKETFVHVNGLIHEIQADDRVEFELQEGRKGMNAVNVRRID